MSSNAEKFCLRWNDFESNISIAFREIREEKDLFDCTLSCGSRQIQAHKIILSACSPFFKSILKMNPHQHPLLYLKGVDFPSLQSVLNFMYHGEVNIAQEELNSFLAVAEDLQVKGLTQNKPDSSHSQVSNKSAAPSVGQETKYKVARKADPARKPDPARQPVQASAPPPSVQQTMYQQQDDDIQEVVPMVKTEPEQVSYTVEGSLAMAGTEVASMQESYVDEGFDYGGYEGVEEQGYEGQYQGGMEAAQQDQGNSFSTLVFRQIEIISRSLLTPSLFQ